jgi:serine/threonine-protein kinase HipA
LGEQQLEAVLDELPHRPMLAGREGVRLSLAGAQDKLPVLFDGQCIGLPQGCQPSTHILKTAILAVQESVLNEGFCMTLAKALGLPTARCKFSL